MMGADEEGPTPTSTAETREKVSENAGNPKPETDIISPQLDSVLRKRGVDVENPQVQAAIEVSMMAWRGSMPLPPPQVMAEFEKIYPGITRKMVEWTDQQRSHRMSLENIRTNRDETRKDRSQLFGGGVAVLGLTLSAVVGIWGSPSAAAVIAIVGVGGPIAAVALAMNLPSLRRSGPAEPKNSAPEKTAPSVNN